MYRITILCLLLLVVGEGLARSATLEGRSTATDVEQEVNGNVFDQENVLQTENEVTEEPVFDNEIDSDIYERENEMDNEVETDIFAGNEILTDEVLSEMNETDTMIHLEYNDTLPLNMTEEELVLYHPGFKARITQKGLDYARDIAIETMMRELSNLQIPDVEQTIAGIDVVMSNIHMIHFPEPESEIRPIPGIGLSWSASGIEPIIEADYQATIGIGFFKITKTGSVRMTGRNLFFDLQFFIGRTFDGKPDISVYDCDAQGLIFFHFEGGWSDTLNFGVTLGQDNIRNLILAQICANARKEIEEGAAIGMQHFPVTHTFEEMFELDFHMVKYPAFYEDALETFHKGEITLVKDGVRHPPPFEAPEMPTFLNHTSKMVYVYISDHLLNSAFYAAYTSGKLAYNISGDSIPEEARGYLSTSCTLSLCLGTLFPELAERYPDGEASLQFYATDSPQVEFLDGEIAVGAAANAEIYIETEDTMAHILTIHINVTAAFTLTMQGQRLTFDLVNIRPEAVIAESALGETEGTEFFFDTMIRIATQQFVVPKLTELGEEGVVIPELPQVSFVDPEVTLDPEVPHVIILATDLTLDTSNF